MGEPASSPQQAPAQFEFLEALTSTPNIDWAHVEMFHLDEYLGLPPNHPASFSKYLLDRSIHKAGITHDHLPGAEDDPAELIRRVSGELRSAPEGEIRPTAPVSILRTHPNATVYLDKLSAALLSSEVRASA